MPSIVFPRTVLFAVVTAFVATVARADSTQTQIRYLSGRGPKDAVPWEFTASVGRRAGEKAVIPVPSNWEQHGFGTYNYGQQRDKSPDRGHYRRTFQVPASWKGLRVRIVFDGVMTDAAVTVNGRSAGPTHRGGFYRFAYDISSLLTYGEEPGAENTLEVDVKEASDDPATDLAERGGDYWVFGGIYRPVRLEATPAWAIDRVAIDGQADGRFAAEVVLGTAPSVQGRIAAVDESLELQIVDREGKPVGPVATRPIPAGGVGRLRIETRIHQPRAWSAEHPNLYVARFTRRRGGQVVHVVEQRFGFRTFEVRPGRGLYLNGRRILLRGVNRHCFRPATGRALDPEDSVADVRLIQEANMNAVRMAHYPPDEHFLEACDKLGLYVINELSGWQRAHATPNGRLLVREMVERDVNHPSILFWANGNEGGWNRDLDGEYALYDPQQRPVLHPWDPFGGVDTKHYPTFDDLAQRLRGTDLVLPTEFMHAMYDGGGAAGLAETWRLIRQSPVGAGGFVWVLADEGIMRTDRSGEIDVFGTFAPDGIVGPHHEREPSFHAIRQIWCPVEIEAPSFGADFTGELAVHNRYDFTSLDECRFTWSLLPAQGEHAPSPEFSVVSPPIGPGQSGRLKLPLPTDWRTARGLAVTGRDRTGRELWTWSWPIPHPSFRGKAHAGPTAYVSEVRKNGDQFVLAAPGGEEAVIDAATGRLRAYRCGEVAAALVNGPRLAWVRPAPEKDIVWTELGRDVDEGIYPLAEPRLISALQLEWKRDPAIAYYSSRIEVRDRAGVWQTVFDGDRRVGDGALYEFPPREVSAVRLSGLRCDDGTVARPARLRVGVWPGRHGQDGPDGPQVSATVKEIPGGGRAAVVEVATMGGQFGFRWSLRTNGELVLETRYTVPGPTIACGIAFDYPEDRLQGVRWTGMGPHRVWQNRLEGNRFGLHELAWSAGGRAAAYARDWRGCYGPLQECALDAAGTRLFCTVDSGSLFLRLGTPRSDHGNTSPAFPAGDVSFMRVIPAIGTKFRPAAEASPSGRPVEGPGSCEDTIVFRLSRWSGEVTPDVPVPR